MAVAVALGFDKCGFCTSASEVTRMVRKIAEKIPDKVVQEDLEKYRKTAIELGATDVKIITTDLIEIDEGVRAKCVHPLCDRYGSNANCPPYAPDLDFMRRVVCNFRYALFSKLETPAESLAGPVADEKRLWVPYFRKINEIVAKIEAEAFYDGYYKATAFGCGSCKGLYCPEVECSALIPGQACKFPLKARASMEGVGMNVYSMATKIGWDIYSVGISTKPSEVPFGVVLGIVLIY